MSWLLNGAIPPLVGIREEGRAEKPNVYFDRRGEWPRPELYPADEYAHLVEEGWEWVDD